MFSKALAKYPYTDLNVIGMVLFILVFVGAVYWVTRKKNLPLIERCSQLPFDDERTDK